MLARTLGVRLSLRGSGIFGQSLWNLRQQLPDGRAVQRKHVLLPQWSRGLRVRLCRRFLGRQQLRDLRARVHSERGLLGWRVLRRLRNVGPVRSVVRRHGLEPISLRELRNRLSHRRHLRRRPVPMSGRHFGMQRRLHQYRVRSLELRDLRNRVRRGAELRGERLPVSGRGHPVCRDLCEYPNRHAPLRRLR
jgi:hypothetical protein